MIFSCCGRWIFFLLPFYVEWRRRATWAVGVGGAIPDDGCRSWNAPRSCQGSACMGLILGLFSIRRRGFAESFKIESQFINKTSSQSLLYTMLFSILAVAVAVAASPLARNSLNPADFQKDVLAASNWYRGQHSANDFKWDDGVAASAQNWADRCSFNHEVCRYITCITT